MSLNNIIEENAGVWERRRVVGFFRAFYLTLIGVLLKPQKFFPGLEMKSYGGAFLFYFIITCPVITISALLNLFDNGVAAVLAYIFTILLVPVITAAGIYLFCGILHPFVYILGGRAGFRATFASVAYASAVSLFKFIPYAGGIIAFLWGAVVFITGVKIVQKMNTIRAVLSFVLPFCLLVVISFLVSIAAPRLLWEK